MGTYLSSSFYESIIENQINDSFWPGYVHAYPHKKSYREILDKTSKDFWRNIPDRLNLYFHIPFCYRKCSFCNLFTVAINKNAIDIKTAYVEKILEHIEYYSKFLSEAEIQSIYFGGGTPNTLDALDIEKIIKKLKSSFPSWSSSIEPSIECYPDLLNTKYLEIIKNSGINRISVGVESFNTTDLVQMSRKKGGLVWDELFQTIKALNLNLNIDIIYGLPGHNMNSVLDNLNLAISYNPEQISIYPLAIRSDTGMGRISLDNHVSMSEKYKMFDASKEILEKANYKCRSYVNWIKSDKSSYQQQFLEFQGVPTLGIGAGARSYSNDFHYALPWKVNQNDSMGIVDLFLSKKPEELKFVGIEMTEQERKNHFIIYSLLGAGLSYDRYQNTFNEDLELEFGDKIRAILNQGCAKVSTPLTDNSISITLTNKGRKYSDIVAHLFTSENVLELYKSFKY